MNTCLLINSEYCSMGRWISVIVGETLGMKLYEGKDLIALCEEEWLTKDYLQAFDQQLTTMSVAEVQASESYQKVQEALSKAILKAVQLGPCIIHERGASEILKGKVDYLSVFLYNKDNHKKIPRARADKTYDLETKSEQEVLAFMKQEDYKREVYHNAVASTKWRDMESYDICLDSEVLSREKCAEILIKALNDIKLDIDTCAKIIEKSFKESR